MKKIDCSKIEKSQFGEYYLSDINQNAFNKVPSEILFKKHFSETKTNYLRIIVGTDSGLLIKFLNQADTERNVTYLFLEYPEVIEYINQNIEYNKEKIKIHSLDTEGLDKYITTNFPLYYLTREMSVSKSISVMDKALDYHERFEQVLEWFYDFLAKRGYEYSGNSFIHNNISLQAFLDNSLSTLEKTIDGIPALILGGGASLDENIEWIKTHQNQFIIIAVARLSIRLLEEGISPDAIMTIDPTELSFSNSKEALKHSENTLLITSNHPNFKLAGQWKGKSVYMGERCSLPTVKNPPYVLSRGNTVSNLAAQFAMVIGCREIYLSGVDFCYLASGQSHEEKSLETKTGIIHDTTISTQNYAGENVGTTANFELGKLSFDNMIRDFKTVFDDLSVYTLSDKTTRMKHISYKPTNQIDLEGFPENNKNYFHEMLKSKLLDGDDLIQDLNIRKKEIQKLIKTMHKALNHIHKKMKLLDPQWSDLNYINEFLEKIVEKTREITKPQLFETIKHYGMEKFILDLSSKKVEVEQQDSLLGLDRISFINLMEESINKIKDKLVEAEQHINMRLSEQKMRGNPENMIEYWMKNNLPGRLLVWKHLLPQLYTTLQDNNPELLLEAQHSYEEQFESETSVQDSLEKQSKNINYYLKQISKIRKQQDINKLEGLKTRLAKNQIDSSAYYELQSLISANITYLENKYEETLKLIDSITTKSAIQFYGLQLKLGMSLEKNDHRNTIETFISLCEYSPSYMPRYAEFLNVIGNPIAAIEIYQMYLEMEPENIEGVIKLYSLIQGVHGEDKACKFLKEKIQEHPENKLLNDIYASSCNENVCNQ